MRIARRLSIISISLFVSLPLLAAVKHPIEPSAVAKEAVTANASSKIEAGLLMTLRDAQLRDRLDRYYKTAAPAAPRMFAVEQGKDGRTVLPLFVDTHDVAATKRAIAAAGGTVSTVVGNHLVAHVPLGEVEALAATSEVDRIEPSYFERATLDVSRHEVKADQVQSGVGFPSPFTGRNVIVGIFDSGIDWSHQDFKDASGHSRIISLWDETQTGHPPAGTTKGYECTRSDIDAGTCPERDTNGHGTHVAGIAAGNGRTRGGQFIGMAPDADLVVVKGGNGSFSRTDIVDGVSYIFRTATNLGKPAVVNLSLGGHSGGHDGTSSYEQSLTNLLGDGKLIVVANGNEGNDRIHLGYDATGSDYVSGTSTFWSVDQGAGASALDVWYSGSVSVGLVANVKSGSDLTAVFNTSGIASGSSFNRTKVTAAGTTIGFVTIQTETTSNGTKHAVVVLDNNDDTSIDMSQVTWEFYTFGSGHVDAWVTQGGSFSDYDDPASGYRAGDFNETVGLPATGSNMIAVGSYTTKVSWTDVDNKGRTYKNANPIGQISTFSSLGPTRDGRRRPIVSAPGEAIASTLSSALDTTNADLRPYLIAGGSYMIDQGTSMAAPHVTGILALMLQARPSLNVTDAYTILRGKARKDSFTGSTANNMYGDGKVDAAAYVTEVLNGSPVTPTVCVPNATTLCLSGNRFAVSTTWSTTDGRSGQGQAVSLTSDTGFFWFFSDTNVEMVLKILNACGFNSRYWVFAGGLTNVQVTMTVIDTKTGTVKTYNNPQGTAFQPIQDTGAFATCP